MNKQDRRASAANGSLKGAGSPGKHILRTGKRHFMRLALLAAVWFAAPAAQAAVVANSVTTAPDIGVAQTVNVSVNWTRIPGAGNDITVNIAVQLAIDTVPAGCVYTAPNMVCTAPAGATGTITFPVRGATIGGFNLLATGTNPPSAAFSGNVRNAGDLTIAKALTLPAVGDPLAGALSTFQLTPNVAAGGNDVPVGGLVIVTDNLPGNAATGFQMTANATFVGLTPVCTAFATANASRTLTCTYSGPFTAAQLNASRINVTGRTAGQGGYINTASITAGSNQYIDINGGNNTATLPYNTSAATDLAVAITTTIGNSLGTASAGNSSQTITLRVNNNGPLAAPAGGFVETVVPAGFVLGALPVGCSAAAGNLTIAAPVNGGTQIGTWNGTKVTCAVGALAVGNNSQFVLPVTLPNSTLTGLYLPAVVTPAAGEEDGIPENNKGTVQYWVIPSAADLGLGKSKSPALVAPGGEFTTTLTITNRGPEIANYGGANGPLRVVDYLDPREIVGAAITAVTAGWTCTVTAGVAAPAGYAGRTTQVSCVLPGPGILAVNANRVVSFKHTIADAATLGPNPVTFTNYACTGSEALSLLGLGAADGPFPADPAGGETNNRQDCRNATGQGTTIITGDAQVNVRKESSVDGANWFDDVAVAPTLTAADNDMQWRMTITTPSIADNAAQKVIPTLELRDIFDGLMRATTTTPGYVTPTITITTSPNTYGSCPATVSGNPPGGGNPVNNASTPVQVCTFTNVPAGTTITVIATLTRPLGVTAANGHLDNTASLTSPNAFLSVSAGGKLSDTARVIVEKRADVALSTKTVTTSIAPGGGGNAVASIGEIVTFVIAARNQGQDPIAAGNFVITDTLFTGAPTAVTPAFDVLSVNPANPAKMSCAGSNLGAGTISCANTAAIDRHETQSISIRARIKRPPVIAGVLGDVLYPNVTNTARVSLLNMCEYRVDGVADSSACGDANALANNTGSAVFDVTVPSFDLQQGKVAVFPLGQTEFLAGDDLRYRFSIRNAGPSIAENIVMTDVLTVPAGFDLVLQGPAPTAVNGAPASAGYSLAAKAITCTQAAADANTVCTFADLDITEEVNFELVFRPVGASDVPAIFGNSANVCADETNSFESSGKCDPDPANAGNNLAGVNSVLFPRTDLEVVSKTATLPLVDIGQAVPYAIVLRNNGISSSTQMRLVDTLPAGFEWVTSAAPSLSNSTGGATVTAPGGALTVLAAVPASPDAANVCYVSNGITNVTLPAQQQQVTCHINGSFPAAGGITLTLQARPKAGVYVGPYLANVINNAEVFPGKDAANEDLAKDDNPANNDKDGPVQVRAGASIGGRVFFDQNNNGDQNLPGDVGIAGVAVTLTGTDLYGNPVNINATTNASGDYSFSNLAPSDATGYTITEDQTSAALAAYSGNGTPQPNTPRVVRNGVSTGDVTGTWVPSNTATQSVISGIVLGNGGAGVQFDFPEFQSVSLSGFVFADRTRNDTYVPASTDTPIPGATVELLIWDAGAADYIPVVGGTTLTLADGSYQFTGLSPSSTYAVRQLLPAGYLNLPSAVKPGQIGGVACAPGVCIAQTAQPGDPVDSDRIIGIQLSANGTNFNFGETVPVSVSGIVFFDVDNSGTQNNPADVGIGSVDIVLTGTDDLGAAVSVTLQTAADGTFSFTNLRPGTYTLTEPTQPTGTINGITTAGTVAGASSGTATAVATTPSAIATINLTVPGSTSVNNLFAEIPRNSSIVGNVWMDADDNGIIDAGEAGLPVVTLVLTGTDVGGNPVNLTTNTDALGRYAFTNLAPGTYVVTEPNQPAGTINGQTVAGSLGGIATPQATTPSAISGIVLGINQNSIENNFGELSVDSSISGRVWLDLNNDGVIGPGEVGIAGVIVNLTGTDVLGNTVSLDTITNPQGRYSFDRLAPGTYTVTEPQQPADTFNGKTVAGSLGGTATPVTTTPSEIATIVLGPNKRSVNNNFGEVQAAAIAGRVYNDNNDNGLVDAAELGIPNVEVVLTGTDDNGAAVSKTTTTDADGRYRFDGLRPGTYALTEPTQPTNTLSGLTTAGSLGGTATPKSVTPSTITGIVLPPGTESIENNFGEIRLDSSISGRVWLDLDNDGVIDTSEVGIAGVTVTLTGTDLLGNPVSIDVVTDAQGRYSFDGLSAGTYAVTEPQQPADTFNGKTVAGSLGGTATPVTTTPSVVSNIVLGAGQHSTENNFGEVQGAAIAGRVYNDMNDNGRVDSTETGIPNVEVVLTGTDDNGATVNKTTTTDADGRYRFDGLLPGTYTVTEPTQPNGTFNGQTTPGSLGGTATPKSVTPSTINGIVLPAGTESIENNFGEVQGAAIAGRVYNDNNDNGQVDAAETGIPNVEVVLTGTDDNGATVNKTTTTDADGRYRFDGLLPGTYTVTEPTQPADTLNGQTTAGSLGGTATPKSVTPSTITSIVLPAGTESIENNFGEVRSAAIAGRVYNDNNDNGQVDSTETGIPNVEIVLTGTDENGATVSKKTTTDADGRYRFDGLRPGTYTVTEPTQPTGTLNGQTTPGSLGGTATPKSVTPSTITTIVLPAATESIENNFGELREFPDMLVSKSVTPDVLVSGNAASYAITVRNGGQSDTAGEYTVHDRLPLGVTLTATPAGEGWICTGKAGDDRFTCRSNAMLGAGQVSASPINVQVTVGAAVDAGIVNNAVLVEGGGESEGRAPTPAERQAFDGDVTGLPVCEPAITRNACRLPSQVARAWPDLVVSKAANAEVFTVGSRAGYSIRARNIGERATVGAYVVVDQLPAGIVLASVPMGDGWTCTGNAGERRFECTSSRVLAVDEIHPGSITVPVHVLPAAMDNGPVNNAVMVSGGGEEPARAPTDEEKTTFNERPGELALCDAQVSQNLCRVPNQVQPALDPAVINISKRGDRSVVEIGDSLLYTIDIRHVSGGGVGHVDVIDQLPRGFTYITGTARVAGAAIAEPQGSPGPTLVFDVGTLPANTQKVLTYRVRVGVGAQQSDGVNRAQAYGCWTAGGCVDPVALTPRPGAMPSNRAEFRVRVSGGVFTDEACVLGKVFVDCNYNHVQDNEELGIPGVRMYFSNGTWVISDSEGKYSYCGLPPQSQTLKVDASTLPPGARLTTSSNRNLGDADSLFLDLKNGEMHRADFIEGTCSNPVLEQVKARRTQGEVRAPETETNQAPLRFESKPIRAPQQATDSANQGPIVESRPNPPAASGSQEVQP